MSINRSQIRDLLLPGLAGLEGMYPALPARYKDFMTQRISRMAVERNVEMAYLGLAALKNEGAPTTMDNSPGERFVYNIANFGLGLGFAITREALDDNLYKEQFNPQAMGLLDAFNQTIDIYAANIPNTATTYNSAIGGDGVSLLSTSHPIDNGTWANTPSVQLSLNESALEIGLTAIRLFPDQRGRIGYKRGKKLLVPPNKEWDAIRLTRTELRTGTANNDVNAIYNSGALPEGYTVNEFLTSNYWWFILTSVEGLIFQNRIPFEMDLQVDPSTGNLLVIGYQRLGVGYTNPRAIWGSTPSA